MDTDNYCCDSAWTLPFLIVFEEKTNIMTSIWPKNKQEMTENAIFSEAGILDGGQTQSPNKTSRDHY